MAKKFGFVFALLLIVALLGGCDRITPEDAQATANAAVVTAMAEAQEATATPDPSVPTSEIMATATVPMATPDSEPTVEAPASTVTISTMTPAPAGEIETEDSTPAAEELELEVEWQEYANGLIALGGFPAESHPARWAGVVQPDNACIGPDEGCWMFAAEGVLSFDFVEDSNDNPSAVWSGGPDVTNVLEQPHSTLLIPDGGYLKGTTGDVDFIVDNLGVRMNAAPDVGYAFVIRGYFHEENRGLAPIEFWTDTPGGVHTIRYPVPPGANGFYSGDHVLEDISNMLGDLRGNADNCDADGCGIIYLVAVDINNDTVSVWRFDALGHELVYTNAVRPTAP